MDISWHAFQLLSQAETTHLIPQDLLDILYQGSNSQYLEALSELATRPELTATIFSTHFELSVDICGRWLHSPRVDKLSALSALAKVAPVAPHLTVFAKALLDQQDHPALQALVSSRPTALQDVSLAQLGDLLLALYRLMELDERQFASSICPAQMQILLNHDARFVRYLAIQLIYLHTHATERALEEMTEKCLGNEPVLHEWEALRIDYTFLPMWERRRLTELAKMINRSKEVGGLRDNQVQAKGLRRVVEPSDLVTNSAWVGGVLVPRLDSLTSDTMPLVMTDTTVQNLRKMAESLNSGRPTLITGPAGSGKSAIARHVAQVLGKESSMVTIHLNEQTDAKSLVGMYVSTVSPGFFDWQPGILTKAIREGRWILIENLDRAPAEILSMLLPLLERGDFYVSHESQTIRPSQGFRIIATITSSADFTNQELDPVITFIGHRLWSRVRVKPQSELELAVIITSRFPILKQLSIQIMTTYTQLKAQYSKEIGSNSRAPPHSLANPIYLLRWCARINKLLTREGYSPGSIVLSNSTAENIFLEAIDSFVSILPNGPTKVRVVQIIAQSLLMPQNQVDLFLKTRVPALDETSSSISIGRITLSKKSIHRSNALRHSPPFATTVHASRILESISASVEQGEPCILVGETGTGKTTMVQKLASWLRCKLTVVNLSQQSEASDLLGGFKPVNLRSVAFPLKEEFTELLHSTFPSKENQQYIQAADKAVLKSRWPRALSLWKEALEAIKLHSQVVLPKTRLAIDEPQAKKRKVKTSAYMQLKPRWDKFNDDLQAFEALISHGSQGFAFSFIEGKIVKAARDGDWVFLDEINLASRDTLESLTDLICSHQERIPSLLLTDSGKLERVKAHKDFRIFAAMNPATDAGKRELPQDIRSRFTEIFIEPLDRDFENLLPVIQAYLGTLGDADVRLAADIAYLHLGIRRLREENALADGANQKPHFSLRTLTRTLDYAMEITLMFGLRRAMYEGFCMSYLTALNKQSERIVEPLIVKQIFGSQRNEKAALSQKPRMPAKQDDYVQFRHYWLRRGPVPVENQDHYVITPFIEQNLLNLVRATSTRRFPVLLQGPTSSGKTSMVEYLAKISGHKFVRINNHEHTDLQEYLGNYVSGSDGQLKYQDGLLVQALRQGHWIVLDELNLAPSDVLEALNRLLDDNRELLVPETQEIVRPHENFMLFATQNPAGLYGGRKILSRAFRNRFLELHFDEIPEEDLETILRERCRIAPSFCARIIAVYKRLVVLRQGSRFLEQRHSFVTLRDLFRWATREADDKHQLAVNGYLLLAERVRSPEEKRAVKEVIEQVMKVEIQEDDVYSLENFKKTSKAALPAPDLVSWTRSMRRLYLLVTQAMQNREPILLVGETGTGKTSICQVVSYMMGKTLHIVNAHQNLETSDLIGSQRPTRQRPSAQSALASLLEEALGDEISAAPPSKTELEVLSKRYESTSMRAPLAFSDKTRKKIEVASTRANSLFEWVDSSLVQSMREGLHFLLDEISLADDSVLERLNSVLEPSRSLLLAEKGSQDVHVAADSEFQFFATMNPGGDYGKRELSPALRNRFTEIWVPSIVDEEEIAEIIDGKLPNVAAGVAWPMVKFASWYTSMVRGRSPTVSIRDLLSWAEFIRANYHAGLEFAVYHGASMIYIDRLGANTSTSLSIPDGDHQGAIDSCIKQLAHLFDYDLSPLLGTATTLNFKSTELSIGPFALERLASIPSNLSYSFEAPTTAKNLLRITRALQLRKPILLEGPPGVGKTTLVSALAQAIGMPLTRINLSDQTDLSDLFGSDVPVQGQNLGNFAWRDAPFLQALQKGHWVLLDEMNLASQTVLEGLNACLDHRGQVYISDLDRTFHKHEKFVLFAAQNPYNQGGGRKGLPASFVDRFITVFMRNFSSEDLTVVCQQLQPRISQSLIERMIQALESLNKVVQRSSIFRGFGGPWEINLRDALRWLQLLTAEEGLASLADLKEFIDLIFIHRFRTLEQKAAARRVLEQSFPESRFSQFHDYVETSSALQIGLGLLPKSIINHSLCQSNLTFRQANLAIIESIMISVQMSWPCLLVGQPGSGKTGALDLISRSLGAEVVTLSLNPDMDATDLLGGFEQSDARRKMMSLAREIQGYTKTAILQHLLSSSESSIAILSTLEKSIQKFLADPIQQQAEIVKLLKTASSDFSSSQFPKFSKDMQSLSDQYAFGHSPRFEWVDGLIVDAVEKGKWLILDNANLCSPSVLDRLNSLLEPQGYLSIDECPTFDESSRLVRPHPNFRLFMVMDPRNGELSRAMRNRSVEIFVPAPPVFQKEDCFPLERDSSNRLYESFRMFDWDALDELMCLDLLNICFDHLSYSQFPTLKRFSSQVSAGLLGVTPPRVAILNSVCQSYENLVQCYRDLFNRTQSFFDGLNIQLGPKSHLKAVQTFHPLNNAATLSNRNPKLRNVIQMGHRFDLLISLLDIERKLSFVIENIPSKSPESLTRLERSYLSQTNPRLANDTTKNVLEFLQSIESFLASCIVENSVIETEREQIILEFIESIINYSNDLLDVTHSATFGEDKFQSYISLGKSLANKIQNNSSTDDDRRILAQQLSSKLQWFGSVNLKTGLGMEKLWRILKPDTAKTSESLRLQLQCEHLGARFDALIWNADSNMNDCHKLQLSLKEFHATAISRDKDIASTLEEISNALDSIEKQAESHEYINTPFFSSHFESLTQYNSIRTDENFSNAKDLLEIFAQRPTITQARTDHASSGWRRLSRIARFSGRVHTPSELASVRQTLPISILCDLSTLYDIPLNRFNLMTTEVDILAKAVSSFCKDICTSQLPVLAYEIYQMHRSISGELRHLDEEASIEDIKTNLRQYLNELSLSSASLRNCLLFAEDALELTLNRNRRVLGAHSGGLSEMSSYLIKLFSGLLLLYVPNRPYDPALTSIIAFERHGKRFMEAKRKLDALSLFESQVRGQDSSFRISLAQEKLRLLETKPESPTVLRLANRTTSLESEFQNILRIVLARVPDFVGDVNSVDRNSTSRLQKVLRMNIMEQISRLEGDEYRAYDDIIQPLTAMLRGLDMGISFAAINHSTEDQKQKSIALVYEIIPFMGLCLHVNADSEIGRQISNGTVSNDFRHIVLHRLALGAIVDQGDGNDTLNVAVELFQGIYNEWRDKLESSQRENAIKSSMFRYRGSREDEEASDEQEFLELFSAHESKPKGSAKTINLMHDPRVATQRLAYLHQELFDSSKSAETKTLEMLADVAEYIGSMWSSDSATSLSPCPAEYFLAPLLLKLGEISDILNIQKHDNQKNNFYSDPNVAEMKSLVSLIQRTQSKFLKLQLAWPEHSTLIDVLKACDDVLSFGLFKTLEKVITKIEQLHGYIYEWQRVASREYSAADIYEELTRLLISWRRLELSTWSRLLDSEDENCKQDANSWWFLAYEIIIATPMGMIESESDIESYPERLFSVLQDFMTQTPIGQFSHHLRIIKCLFHHFELLLRRHRNLQPIQNALSNILFYFNRFSNPILDTLLKGREACGKELREILLLASWKDTNIVALRESAKRSHNRLFKVVRKYRSLLSQPASDVVTRSSGIIDGAVQLSSTQSLGSSQLASRVDKKALEVCQISIPEWPNKPARQTNPDATAHQMLHLSRTPQGITVNLSYLENFTSDLLDNIKALRKETPSLSTEENAPSIRSLQVRKRKLFGETLKTIRYMGLSSNPSSDVLSGQSSLAKILANVPTFQSRQDDLSHSGLSFVQFVDVMQKIRTTRQFSEDLNHSEVTRSISHLESILALLIKQRKSLMKLDEESRSLESARSELSNIWMPDEYTICSHKPMEESILGEQNVLKWLDCFTAVTAVILQTQQGLGGNDTSEVREELSAWRQRNKGLSEGIGNLRKLPEGVSSTLHKKTMKSSKSRLQEFQEQLRYWMDEMPNSSFAIQTLLSCIEKSARIDEKGLVQQHSSLNSFDTELSGIIDSMLVAIQRMAEAFKVVPDSNENRRWLLQVDLCFEKSAQILSFSNISSRLKNIMATLSQLGSASDHDLKIASALCASFLPIIDQYCYICKHQLQIYISFHSRLCQLASVLADVFQQIARDGFCSPQAESLPEKSEGQKLEEGTGLGEGEGAQDISKDVQDDEDLSDLAQQAGSDERQEEIENEDDAVDMDHDDLEGELQNGTSKSDDEDTASGSDDENDDLDEEVGSVDDSDPTAVDEKLWDGAANEDRNHNKEAESKLDLKKDPKNDVGNEHGEVNVDPEDKSKEAGEEEEDAMEGAEENEDIQHQGNESIDPHVEEEQKLDLPEEMEIDGPDRSESTESSDDGLDAASDIDADNDNHDESEDLETHEENGHSKNADGQSEDEDPELDGISDVDEEDAVSPPQRDSPATKEDNLSEDPHEIISSTQPEPDQQQLGGEQGPERHGDDQIGENASEHRREKANMDTAGVSSGQDEEMTLEESKDSAKVNSSEEARSQDSGRTETGISKAFKQLGDALEKWHRQKEQIRDADTERNFDDQAPQDLNMADQLFEHLRDEEDKADTQALGAASEEQATALDKAALESAMTNPRDNFDAESEVEDEDTQEDEAMRDVEEKDTSDNVQRAEQESTAFVARKQTSQTETDSSANQQAESEEDFQEIDNELSLTHLQAPQEFTSLSTNKARDLWLHNEERTRELCLFLTERLRLILAPTLATKLRGDFRTGKRLNIKRIIPYIVSDYKRDKIWMRRSVPSKRSYQIMLAVDDSRSMQESGSGALAFESLALVAKSLSMLEVGEICIVGFGKDVFVAHDFDKPFTSEVGGTVYQRFGFQQTGTNVRQLVTDSIKLFREAKQRQQTPSSGGSDIWQLEIIISDGVCEDHESIRRLLQQAYEERIMIVFVIVDALVKEGSILDLTQAVFEADPATGETGLRMKRYLDGFPFEYYLVVNDVRDLPDVLSQALSQWFAEVVESA